MRILPLLLAGLFVSGLTGWAQLSVEVILDQEQYLRDESLMVKVRITNRSGQTLRLGEDNEWLALVVETLEQNSPGSVTRLAELPVRGVFTLESAKVATRQVDLTPSFDISEPGRYQVNATVRIKAWNEEVSSKPRPFEVVRGTKIWEQEFGVPTKAGPPEARKYILQQANYHKQLKLYLRLTDGQENNVFRVFSMGPLVSFSQTEVQIDKASYLHVLFQAGARNFIFAVVSPGGDEVVRQTYDYTATRPTLRANDEGRIYVTGGSRRVTATDIPSPMVLAPPLVGTGTNSTNQSLTNLVSTPPPPPPPPELNPNERPTK
jgi:hypothetical protein